jgi:rubredoxin
MADEQLADEAHKCPVCGERRVDWLVWINDDQVRCSSCQTVYAPERPPDDPLFGRN